MITEIETSSSPQVCGPYAYKRISWTAIFVGAFVGIGLIFLVNLFTIAIGLSVFTAGSDGAMALSIGGFIGLVIGIIASMLVSGYAAGYLGRFYCPLRNLGIIYGFTTWSLALLLSAVIGTHVSSYVVNYSHAITSPTVVMDDNSQTTPAVIKTTATDNGKNVVKVAVSASDLAWTAFTIFVLFFIGAVSTCIGACCGMSCRREE